MTNAEIREARRRIKKHSERDPKTGCWVWKASQRGTGYSQVRWKNKVTSGHRLSYQVYVSEIPESSVVHHTCGNRMCVNPKHLQLVTQADNLAEMLGRTAMQKRIAELEERLSKYE